MAEANLKILLIQRKIDQHVRILLHCPQVIEVCPSLSKYQSTIRKIDPNVELPEGKNVKTLVSILTEYQAGKPDPRMLKTLDKIFRDLARINLEEVTPFDLYEWVQFLAKGAELAKEPNIRAILKHPAFLARIWGIFYMPEGAEAALNEQLHNYEELQKNFTDLIVGSGRFLPQYKAFLSPVDKIISIASTYCYLKSEGIPEALELGLKETVCDEQRHARKMLKSDVLEKSALGILNEKDPAKLYSDSRSLVNGKDFRKLPIAAQMVVLKTLAEKDENFGEYFKRKTMKLAESILELSLDKLKV